jgi:1-deoxy-D-xylulose-5-phosphate reductoisomerase
MICKVLEMQNVTILGCTGSIGTNTLDVIRRNGDRYGVFALAAGQNIDLLYSQILEFRPKVAVTASETGRTALARKLAGSGLAQAAWPELLSGPEALVQISVAPEVYAVMSSIVGVAGLDATYQAVRQAKRVGLANKEVLVTSGRLVMDAVKESGCEMIPVDSEHNGAHQCLRAGRRNEATKLILTASGGPFRNTSKEAMAKVTPAQALKHPTWKMGNRITIDSATLMNKGFEVIEACWLFGFDPQNVEVVVHPQSTVHAMVEYNDGSVIAQVCATDMRMPIQYALTWPDRLQAPVPKIDWSVSKEWQFSAPDFDRFPLLKLAYHCQEAAWNRGSSATCTLNAADEIAVEAFLAERISYPEIAYIVEETLQRIPERRPQSIGDILCIDEESRAEARELVARYGGAGVSEGKNRLSEPARA